MRRVWATVTAVAAMVMVASTASLAGATSNADVAATPVTASSDPGLGDPQAADAARDPQRRPDHDLANWLPGQGQEVGTAGQALLAASVPPKRRRSR